MPDDTVDGRNPAAAGMYKTLWILGYLLHQLVQDSTVWITCMSRSPAFGVACSSTDAFPFLGRFSWQDVTHLKFLVLDEADDLQKKDDRKEQPFFCSPGPCQVAGAWKNWCFFHFYMTCLVLDLGLVVGFQEILVFIQLRVRSVSCVLIQVYVEWDSASTAHLTPFIKSSNFIQSSYQLAILLRNHVRSRKLT